MNTTQRVAAAERLRLAEVELRQAQAGMDGSPGARTRLHQARVEHRAAESLALGVLAKDSRSAGGRHEVEGDAAGV